MDRYCTEKIVKDCGKIGGYNIEIIEGGGFIIDDCVVFCGEDAKKLFREIALTIGLAEITNKE